MIQISDLTKIFQTSEIETHALSFITLTIDDGEFLSIMGPSGCGKTTLLNIIGLLDDPSSGDVILNGHHILGLTDREKARIRNEEIGFIFQDFHLISSLNVIDNVTLPLSYHTQKTSYQEKKERAMHILEKVGLDHRTQHYPNQLSGGQCQRAAIARALITDPKIILADEPTGNLDSKTSNEIIDIITELNDGGCTVLMVTHDEKIADRTGCIVRMLDGKIVNNGKD